ncbi:MAG: branched-chain amino acid ABC transporter permease [Chloroflexi bacterium]|nr:branched-chain amino acid ABC transporter permease [Chloroflexota bacterium]
MSTSQILQQVFNALQLGSFYALIALGYSMVYSILMLFNFAHGDVFMVATYIGYGIATLLLSLAASMAFNLPGWVTFTLTLLLTMFVASFVGVLVELVAYRPLRDAPRASAAITGLMVGIFLETAVLTLVGASNLNFPELIKPTTYRIGSVYITNIKVLTLILSFGLMILLHLFIQKTKIGMAMRAMSYDYAVIPLMGVPLNTIISFTFALGSALAGAAGVLYGMAYPVLNPYMGVLVGWKAFVAAILGGRGSILGAVLGGFLLGAIEILVAAVFTSTLRDLIAYSIVLLILTFRPYGLFGEEHSARLRL